MTFGEIFTAGSVLALAAWAFHTMRRAIRSDADRRAALRDFAKAHELTEVVVDKAPGEIAAGAAIDWKTLARSWSRSPALAAPIRGAVVFEGKNGGFPFVVDEVWVRKRWTNVRDPYLRMAVEPPAMPHTLEVSPARGLARLVRAGASNASSTAGAAAGGRRTNLTFHFSTHGEARVQEQSYLTAQRIGALEELQAALGGVYVHGGRLLAVRRSNTSEHVDLDGLYAALGRCAQKLAR